METAIGKLRAWSDGRSTRVAAKALGISQATFVQLLSGKASRVSVVVALKIQKNTRGAVRVEDWVTPQDLLPKTG
jgi:DNA-binding transcriptional regulator YdaS (Cro superfamily)